jgi:hypothetical protein
MLAGLITMNRIIMAIPTLAAPTTVSAITDTTTVGSG